VLKIVIHKLELDDFGVYTVVPGLGVLGDMVKHPSRKLVSVQEQMAILSEELKISLKPNIGTIGVAPAKGVIPSGLPGDHGGNMDTKEIKEGATLYLPIFVPGALFALGDLHICMGDGEICGSGGGAGGRVHVSLSLVHGKSLRRPLLKADNSWFTIANGKTLDEAVRMHASLYWKQHLNYRSTKPTFSQAPHVM
jgi:amidase